MITNSISRRANFSLFFALLPYFVFSTPFVLTPDNLQDVFVALSDQHEEEITISMAEVQQFLEQSIAGTYNANLSPPKAAITEIDDEQIAFAWPEIAQANTYLTRYLNLDNGDFGELTTEDPGAHFTLENHLYLYTFRASSAKAKGMVWVIIHDKPLSLSVGPNFTSKYCTCEDPVNSTGYALSMLPQVLLESPYAQPFEEIYSIQLSFSYQNGPVREASFMLRLLATGSSITHAYFHEFDACSSNFRIESGNDCIYVVDPVLSNEAVKVYFPPGGASLEFVALPIGVSSNYYNGSLTLSKCKKNKGNDPEPYGGILERRNKEAVQLVPNPSADVVSFYLDQWTDDQQARLILRNVRGETLQDFQTIVGARQEIDLSAYSNGTYYLQVISGKQREVYPIVKME